MITVQALHKNYGSKTVLKDINLLLEKGKIYGIVGENGAGKTTFFRCLAGLENYQGNIKSNEGVLKNRLGLLETEPWFFPKITGKEYIQLLCNARHKKMPDLANSNIFELPLNQYAAQYSTGMKKKLALTALLLQENEVLILDEPFNGVDIHSNLIITEIIHQLKKLGKTILIASHIFSTLNQTCDCIYLLRNAQLEPPVYPPDFPRLEEQLKNVAIGNRIAQMGLQ